MKNTQSHDIDARELNLIEIELDKDSKPYMFTWYYHPSYLIGRPWLLNNNNEKTV